jgi:predicted metal-binding membrane protein
MMLGMWVVMMTGMMVPTAMRSVLIFSRLAVNATAAGHAFASGYWFALGYVIAWSLFSVAATLLQWALDRLSLLSPMMTSSSAVLTGLILMGAGLWQLSPWKEACLRHCRSPMEFLATHFSDGAGGAVRMGMSHGFYCLGCCWVLMGLLFVGGVMNLACIAAITAFVLAEKLLPSGPGLGRLAGLGLIAFGFLFFLFLST